MSPKRKPELGWRPKPYHFRKPGQKVGLLRVRISGVTHYCGRWDDPAAWQEYDRLLAEWSASNYSPRAAPSGATVAELLNAFLKWAENDYRSEGKPTGELYCCKTVIRETRTLYGGSLVKDFTPDSLRAVRERFVELGWSRNHCNEQTNRLRRIFRWGLANGGYVPAGILEPLQAVPPLMAGKTRARETEEKLDVPEDVIRRTLPLLPKQVAAMVKVQRLAGMRPSEVCLMRVDEIDCSEAEWLFQPAKHKNLFRGKKRRIWLGPKAQALLKPFLRKAGKSRKSKSHNAFVFVNRAGTPYTKDTYGRAIARAIDAHNETSKGRANPLPRWSPMQLRKSAATDAEERYNLEHAKALLGQSKSDVTAKHYAKADDRMARRVARETG